jgi:hypothetical protein
MTIQQAAARVIYNDNGVPTLHGRGLEDVKRRIMDAFDAVRAPATPPAPAEVVVDPEEHKERFQRRTERLTAAALSCSHVMSEVTNGPIYVAPPTESAEELFKMLDDFNMPLIQRNGSASKIAMAVNGRASK